jgi:hypothetical protein
VAVAVPVDIGVLVGVGVEVLVGAGVDDGVLLGGAGVAAT